MKKWCNPCHPCRKGKKSGSRGLAEPTNREEKRCYFPRFLNIFLHASGGENLVVSNIFCIFAVHLKMHSD